jgi:hypothetical protein
VAAETAESAEAPVSAEVTDESSTSAPETVETVSETPVEKAVSAETKRESNKLIKLVKLHNEMSELITELGLSGTTDSDSTSEPQVAEVVKAEIVATTPDPDVMALVKALTDEITAVKNENSALRVQVEKIKEFVPEIREPELLVQKAEDSDPLAALMALPAEERLRVALSIKTQGK